MLEKQQRTVWLPKNHFQEDFSNTGRLIPKGSVGWANVTSVTVFLEFRGGIRSFDAASRKGALFPTLRAPPVNRIHFHGVHLVSLSPFFYYFYFIKAFVAFMWSSNPLLVSILLFVNAIT